VGKTHLLAATFFAWKGAKFYASFSGLTSLVGALSFSGALNLLQGATLLAIDEFELDDPGDTVLISRLADELLTTGTNLVVTSNTLPTRLGEGRFGAQDFLREIQGLADAFEVLPIEGGDFRRRNFVFDRGETTFEPLPEDAVRVELKTLLDQLQRVHPIRYRGVVQEIPGVEIGSASSIELQSDALRFCSLVDVLYDFGVPVRVRGCDLEELFPASFLVGGFRQKYGRCLSRLYELETLEDPLL
jgi:cell division protein ZapE